MVRVVLILMFCATVVALVMIVTAASRQALSAGARASHPIEGLKKDKDMATSGVQKAAFVALILILFGVASGWLGGL